MPDTVNLTLRSDITLERVSDLIAKLVDLQGCPSCGFNGFDLHIAVDPETRFVELRNAFREDLVGIDVVPGPLARRQIG